MDLKNKEGRRGRKKEEEEEERDRRKQQTEGNRKKKEEIKTANKHMKRCSTSLPKGSWVRVRKASQNHNKILLHIHWNVYNLKDKQQMVSRMWRN